MALTPRVPSVPTDAELVLDSDNKPLPVRDFSAPHLSHSEGTKQLPPGARRWVGTEGSPRGDSGGERDRREGRNRRGQEGSVEGRGGRGRRGQGGDMAWGQDGKRRGQEVAGGAQL